MDRLDDHELVAAARNGQAGAFAELISRHYPALLGACRRMLNGRDSAHDAAQEATVRAMLGLSHLRDEHRFAAWLIGIGLNVCRGLLTASARGALVQAGGEQGLREIVDETADPFAITVAAQMTERVRAAIATLPEGQRQAVAMFYLAGLTHAEIAQELATRPGAIKTRLHKARRTLRAELKDTYEEYPPMPTPAPQMIPMQLVEVRRARSQSDEQERHILFLEDEQGQRLPIWIGPAEAIQIALILEKIQMPRPGAYQFAASLLSAAGAQLKEVLISELTDSTFYAEAILDNETRIDARPSDALTLALITGAPIYASAHVLQSTQHPDPDRQQLIDEANTASDSTQIIAQDAIKTYQIALLKVQKPAT